ncbi:MAG: zinc metalloprotease [Acidobacteriota bacterium]
MKVLKSFGILTALVVTLAGGSMVFAGDVGLPGDAVVIDGVDYQSMTEYFHSEHFKSGDRRCGTPDYWAHPEVLPGRDTADCTMILTNPDPIYDPDLTYVYEIPVVVHIITHDNGVTGDLTDQMVQSQIDVLNEDYLAMPGTLGENGNFTGIRFVLATEDPDGLPTTGITRTANTNWYNDNDESGFKSTLMWDPNRYLNFYTNNTVYLGYAWFPQWGVGGWQDGIVITYRAFGRNSPMYPYNLGRTATHEVGHWLGLLHTFQDGCGTASAPGCYSTGDRICDTDPDATQTFGCPSATSCGSYPIPVENYMEYTDDACMELFTPEQANRARCSLTSYRPIGYSMVLLDGIFHDGFESGDTTGWSFASP